MIFTTGRITRKAISIESDAMFGPVKSYCYIEMEEWAFTKFTSSGMDVEYVYFEKH